MEEQLQRKRAWAEQKEKWDLERAKDEAERQQLLNNMRDLEVQSFHHTVISTCTQSETHSRTRLPSISLSHHIIESSKFCAHPRTDIISLACSLIHDCPY